MKKDAEGREDKEKESWRSNQYEGNSKIRVEIREMTSATTRTTTTAAEEEDVDDVDNGITSYKNLP